MLIDIKSRIFDNDIKALISHSMFEPDEPKLARIAEEYLTDENRFLLGWELQGKVVGCAGVDATEQGKAVLHHIAVDPAYRGQGIGREMIGEIVNRFGSSRLEAETDDDAVGFYRKCGFQINSLGEKYPGCVRYLCLIE